MSIAGTTLATTTCAQETAPAVVPAASHDIVMRMSVPASCRMTASAPQIQLTGTSDDGVAIDTTLTGEGGLVVDCNTPYAMTLSRTPVYAMPRGALAEKSPAAQARGAALSAGPSVRDSIAAHAEEQSAHFADDLTVLVRFDTRGDRLESSCVMARSSEASFRCRAFADPDVVQLPPPRGAASLIVTGAIAPTELKEEGSAPEARESEDASQSVEPNARGGNAHHVADMREDAVVRMARQRVIGRRIGDQLTVSLSARH